MDIDWDEVHFEAPFIALPVERRSIIIGRTTSKEHSSVDVTNDVRRRMMERFRSGVRSGRELQSTLPEVSKKGVDPEKKSKNSPALLVDEEVVMRQVVRLTVGVDQARDGHGTGKSAE